MNILRCEFIGEAMRVKNFLFFFLLLIPSILFSQDINIQSLKSMKNEDLKTYLNQAQKEGYSLDQIKINSGPFMFKKGTINKISCNKVIISIESININLVLNKSSVVAA